MKLELLDTMLHTLRLDGETVQIEIHYGSAADLAAMLRAGVVIEPNAPGPYLVTGEERIAPLAIPAESPAPIPAPAPPARERKPRGETALEAAVLAAIANTGNSGASMGELYTTLPEGSSAGQIRRALDGLREAGKVRTTGNKRAMRYFAVEQAGAV